MRTLALLVGILLLSSNSYGAEAGSEYRRLPSASERANEGASCKLFPDFPRMEFVKEGFGTPNPEWQDFLEDQTLKAEIEAGHFRSLQVRDLCTEPDRVYSEGSTVHYPFMVSVKHTQGAARLFNGDQGTIEVLGDLIVHIDGMKVKDVEVKAYDDSQVLERLRRKVGFNREINLSFSRAIVKPALENFFNTDPQRVALLLKSANLLPVPTMPEPQRLNRP